MKAIFVAILCTVNICFAQGVSSQNAFFNTPFLSNGQKVFERLTKKEGFKERYFITKDGLKINCIWLSRAQAKSSVICCAGFWPGRKEGIATLYALLPKDCNILFFDARGHAKSDGKLWQNLLNYGVHESKDVEAAVAFVRSLAPKPIILWGICAGAYHAAHATLALGEEGVAYNNIRGLIFDSGWSLTPTAGASSFGSEFRKVARSMLKTFPAAISYGADTLMLNPLRNAVEASIRTLAAGCMSKKVYQRDLRKHIHRMAVPAFYIHASCDQYASIKEVKKLAQKTPSASVWWIEQKSSHACHHIKFASEYRNRMQNFILECLDNSQKLS